MYTVIHTTDPTPHRDGGARRVVEVRDDVGTLVGSWVDPRRDSGSTGWARGTDHRVLGYQRFDERHLTPGRWSPAVSAMLDGFASRRTLVPRCRSPFDGEIRQRIDALENVGAAAYAAWQSEQQALADAAADALWIELLAGRRVAPEYRHPTARGKRGYREALALRQIGAEEQVVAATLAAPDRLQNQALFGADERGATLVALDGVVTHDGAAIRVVVECVYGGGPTWFGPLGRRMYASYFAVEGATTPPEDPRDREAETGGPLVRLMAARREYIAAYGGARALSARCCRRHVRRAGIRLTPIPVPRVGVRTGSTPVPVAERGV